MAVIQPEVAGAGRGSITVTWANVTESDTCAPWDRDLGGVVYTDKNIHGYGTFGTGGQWAVQGRNASAANYQTLNEPDGTAISGKTAEGLFQILENPLETRPAVTAGTGVSLTFVMVGRGIIQKS